MRQAAVIGLLIIVFLSTELWAQDEIFNHPLNANNMNVFIATCTRLAENPVIKGNFEQEKTLKRLDRLLKSSGNFIIASGLGMAWETVNPFPSTLILGKNYMAQSRPGGQKTVLSSQGNETFTRIAEVISSVFSGNAKELLDNFEIFFQGSAAEWELGLIPLDRAIGSFAERMLMKGDSYIKFIQIFEQNGDTVKYFLSNHNHLAELNVNEKTLFIYP